MWTQASEERCARDRECYQNTPSLLLSCMLTSGRGDKLLLIEIVNFDS